MDYEKILGELLEQESTSTFWAGQGVIEPDVYRLEKQYQRWYYTINPVKFYTSITTWLKQVMPSPYHLEKWFKENDLEYLDARLHYSSHYGTFAHIMMGLLMKYGKIDLKNIELAVDVYWSVNEIEPYDIDLGKKEQWADKIRNDLLCIVSFIQEREFKAIAVEWMGQFDGSDKVPFSWAGQIDLVGEITFNGTRKTAIIDLKTGSLYADQVYQLIGNKLQWDQHNDQSIDLLMNLSPGDFTNKIKYTLKNHKVDSDTFDTFCDYARIASRTVKVNPKPITDFDRELSRDSNLNDFSIEPEQYVKTKHS